MEAASGPEALGQGVTEGSRVTRGLRHGRRSRLRSPRGVAAEGTRARLPVRTESSPGTAPRKAASEPPPREARPLRPVCARRHTGNLHAKPCTSNTVSASCPGEPAPGRASPEGASCGPGASVASNWPKPANATRRRHDRGEEPPSAVLLPKSSRFCCTCSRARGVSSACLASPWDCQAPGLQHRGPRLPCFSPLDVAPGPRLL